MGPESKGHAKDYSNVFERFLTAQDACCNPRTTGHGQGPS